MNGHGIYHIKWSRSDNANAIWYHLMGNLKKKYGTNELTYKTESKVTRENSGYGRDKLGDWDWHIHTTLYKIYSI